MVMEKDAGVWWEDEALHVGENKQDWPAGPARTGEEDSRGQ